MTRLTARTKQENDAWADWAEYFILYGVTLSAVWLNAWIWNPRLTSGTVWFIASVAGTLVVILHNPREA
jgi:hypothetical protein